MRHKFSIILILWAVLLPACQHTDKDSGRQPIEVETMRIDSAEAVNMNTYVGKVEEGTSLQLRFPLGGKITSVRAKKGQRVRQGELLATTDDTQPRNALQTAEATLAQAQDAYERLKQVYEQGALAEVKWIEIKTQLQKAKATADAARQQVNDCKLYAPQNGIIEECDLRTGQQLLPAQTAVTLINTDGVQIVFPVPEKEIAAIRAGDKAEITVPALDDLRLTGTIGEKDMLSNPLTHSYNAKIYISNKDGMLMPGMMCKVACLGSRVTGYVIPASCVQTMQYGISVWVVKEGKAIRRSVTSSAYVKGGILIDSGIEQGNIIITGGYQKLYEGAEVREKDI
ncbi:MAG: efflux RND transporter periplasmic adaptor subunit [Paludibacteraceae bacterium]|nr:efflux RND transporter periplasmic adaptor subunit [Paludibacteraceae bacterium]